MRGLIVTFLGLLLAGCGGGDASSPDEVAASSAPPALTLREACPEIEAGLPEGVVPSASRWSTYAAELRGLQQAGDTETNNAVGLLLPAVDGLAADPRGGIPLLDARADLRDSLDAVAKRCRSVGSSALQ